MSTPEMFETAAPETPDAASHATATEHVSLYRKYRPQTFAPDELVGQAPIVQALRNAVRLDRVAHAYLFAGPRGTGKTTTARLLAKAVNCLDENPENRPCNRCAACMAIAAGSAVDVVEIDAASNRGIDDIRDLRERVRFVPTSLKTKFYIIDEAHQITGAAANAFLKTLEEPPEHTRFVLATTDPEQILSTIVSRCQRFDFRRFSVSVTVAQLESVARKEGIAIEPAALRLIAEQSTGSMRDALGLLDQLAVFGDSDSSLSSPIRESDVRSLLGIARSDAVIQLLKAIQARDAGKSLVLLNEAIDRGEDARQINRQLVDAIRHLLLAKLSPSGDTDETLVEIGDLFDARKLMQLARHFSNVDFRGRSLPVPHLPLEIALAQVCLEPTPLESGGEHSPASTPTPSPSNPPPTTHQPVARPSMVERATQRPQTIPRAQTASAAPTQSTPGNVTQTQDPAQSGSLITVRDLDQRWQEIRSEIKLKSRRIEALLNSVNPVSVNGNTIVLVSAYPFHRDKLNEPEVQAIVEGVIGTIFGQTVSVSVQLHSENVKPVAQNSGTSSSRENPPAKPSGDDKEILDMAQTIYDAEIIESENET